MRVHVKCYDSEPLYISPLGCKTIGLHAGFSILFCLGLAFPQVREVVGLQAVSKLHLNFEGSSKYTFES